MYYSVYLGEKKVYNTFVMKEQHFEVLLKMLRVPQVINKFSILC
jgi:hypothetical protein